MNVFSKQIQLIMEEILLIIKLYQLKIKKRPYRIMLEIHCNLEIVNLVKVAVLLEMLVHAYHFIKWGKKKVNIKKLGLEILLK